MLRSPPSELKIDRKKDTLQKYRVSYCFNLFFLCYKPRVREQKILCFRSELGLSYNTNIILVGNIGKKCHLTCSLDSGGELSLVKSAGAGNTSGEDLCSLGNELSELSNVLIIDSLYLVLAEDANLLSSVVRTEGGALRIVSLECHYKVPLSNLSDSRFLFYSPSSEPSPDEDGSLRRGETRR